MATCAHSGSRPYAPFAAHTMGCSTILRSWVYDDKKEARAIIYKGHFKLHVQAIPVSVVNYVLTVLIIQA